MPQGHSGRFACQFDGCGRSFGRQEHLQRHVLNHTSGDFTCDRCRTVFKRPDLLGDHSQMLHPDPFLAHVFSDRHLARHRQKDAEGSTLMTRKRLYKDSEGRVINKRPAKARASKQAEESEQPAAASIPELPLSPPGSATGLSSLSSGGNDNTDFFPFTQEPSGAATQPTLLPEHLGEDVFSWNDSFPPVYDQNISDGPFEDIFMPDTASSFNMPYVSCQVAGTQDSF